MNVGPIIVSASSVPTPSGLTLLAVVLPNNTSPNIDFPLAGYGYYNYVIELNGVVTNSGNQMELSASIDNGANFPANWAGSAFFSPAGIWTITQNSGAGGASGLRIGSNVHATSQNALPMGLGGTVRVFLPQTVGQVSYATIHSGYRDQSSGQGVTHIAGGYFDNAGTINFLRLTGAGNFKYGAARLYGELKV